jgi:hypothetical protein
MTDIQEKIGQEIKEAREVCDAEGKDSENCAAAWDAVEELQAAAAHEKDKVVPVASALDNYCADNPEADECRIYED